MLRKLILLLTTLALFSGLVFAACYDGDTYADLSDQSSYNDIYIKSFVADGDVRKIDSCMDHDYLWEYDCSAKGGRKVLCEYGCESGACRIKPQDQYHIPQTGHATSDFKGKSLNIETILLLVLLGAVIAIIYSLRKIYGLERQLRKLDIKIEKLLRQLIKRKR